VYTRSPSVIAASANVISQVIPGRFVLGLGSSSQTIMGQWNGIPLDKPLTRVKETAQLVRQMLKGEKTDFKGRDAVQSRLSPGAHGKPAADLHWRAAPEND
jgi:alkanesulfonate monooxygenase SsuD/methylene tetrahydromethanopterin reductase-like flavin-dependent oxidoreductase (luciferase family)